MKRIGAAAAAAAVLVAGSAARADERGFDCVIRPAATVRIGSPVAGLLAEVTVERGDRVMAGQTLARLESAVEQATLALTRVQAQSDAAVRAQEERRALAALKLDRARRLAKSEVMARQQLDELESELLIDEQSLVAAQTERDLAAVQVQRAEAELARRTIVSPLDGTIVERQMSPGEYVHQESQIVTVVRLDPLYVEAYLPVRLYGTIQVGLTGTVVPEQPVGGSYQAAVTVVDQVFDAASNTFGVRLALPNPDGRLPAGLRCTVAFPPTTEVAKAP